LFLSFVNDPVGIRHMRRVLTATELVDPIILNGLYRINSEEARALLAEAAGTGTGERAAVATSLLQSLQRRSVERR
jgi:hypothetical protein